MITSASNPRVKNLKQLLRKARARDEQGVFVAEGVKMFREAPRERIEEVYVSQSLYERQGRELLDGWEPEVLGDLVFAAVSDTQTPQGILCVVRQSRYQAEEIINRKNAHLLILENLQDPGNLGTIIRSAEGAGVDGVILSKDCVDMYNPKTIRSTMGSIYRMPFVYADCLDDILVLLKENGIRTYAAHLEGQSSYDREDYRAGCAFLIGNEGSGLSEALSRKADVRIRIPMHGKLESLNAAVAASILMYEASRQRQESFII